MSAAQSAGRGGTQLDAGRLRSRMRSRAMLAPWLAIVCVWAISAVVLAVKTVPVSGDGIYYFVQLESLVQDGDLDYANNLEAFRDNPHVAKQLDSGVVTPTGKTPNLFSIGPAILWAPVYLLAYLVAPLIAPLFSSDARQVELLAPSIATSIYVLLGLLLSYATARRLGLPRWPCALGVIAVFTGTNLLYYATFEASMSHGLGFSLVAALVYLTVRHRESPRLRYWLLLGLVAGLAICVRWQLALVVLVVPGFEVIRHIVHGRPGRALAFVVGIAVGVLPQLLVWRRLYGTWLTIPQGSGFIDWSSPHFGEVLVSSRHGLLSWTPLVLAGLVGLLIATRSSDRRRRFIGMAGVLVIALQTYINGSLIEWWGGDAFGARRFTDVSVFAALGLAVLLANSRHWVRATTLVLCALLVGANLLLMQFYRLDRIPRSQPIDWTALVEAWRN